MNITECWEAGTKNHPETLREIGVDRIIGREIIEYSGCKGTYGMGGPGFVGFRLDKTADYKKEWLILTLWGATDWLLYDSRWVSAHPNQYEVQRPLIGIGDEVWDEFTEKVIGAKILEIDFCENSSKLTLGTNDDKNILEIPEDVSLLPKYGGTLQSKLWDGEDQMKAWVISKSGNLRC
ncbi:MAG: hypothetical protein COA79_14305 [Planctomycetota bacterium]|nr:MAG: hypothetical protein COA79_14305 [Planctomycetota bacterium]